MIPNIENQVNGSQIWKKTQETMISEEPRVLEMGCKSATYVYTVCMYGYNQAIKNIY